MSRLKIAAKKHQIETRAPTDTTWAAMSDNNANTPNNLTKP